MPQHILFTFVCHYASREVSCGILTKIWRAHELFETFVFSPFSAHGVKPGCSQGGKVTFRNMLCTFKLSLNILDGEKTN